MSKTITKEKAITYVDNYANNGLNKTKAYMKTMKVGYRQANAHCTDFHNRVVKSGKIPKEYFNEETVKRDIKKIKRLTLKKEDFTNALRATELESKILGMQVDKSEVLNRNPDQIKIILANTKSPTENVSTPKSDDCKSNDTTTIQPQITDEK
jgi:hypothetical protein